MTGATTLPLLAARGVFKSFGAVEALVDVDFDVDAGEVVALGRWPADAGRMWFGGREVSIRSPQDASRLGIATVYQDLALCDNLDVVGNVYLWQGAPRPRARSPRPARRGRDGAPYAGPVRQAGRDHPARSRARCPAASGKRSPSPARSSASRAS
jgi:hypothetical protein